MFDALPVDTNRESEITRQSEKLGLVGVLNASLSKPSGILDKVYDLIRDQTDGPWRCHDPLNSSTTPGQGSMKNVANNKKK